MIFHNDDTPPSSSSIQSNIDLKCPLNGPLVWECFKNACKLKGTFIYVKLVYFTNMENVITNNTQQVIGLATKVVTRKSVEFSRKVRKFSYKLSTYG